MYGKNSKTGRERFQCNNPECGHRTFHLEYKYNARKPEMRGKMVEMVMNGAGTQDTGRVLGVLKDTVTKVLSISFRTSTFDREIFRNDENCSQNLNIFRIVIIGKIKVLVMR